MAKKKIQYLANTSPAIDGHYKVVSVNPVVHFKSPFGHTRIDFRTCTLSEANFAFEHGCKALIPIPINSDSSI